MNATLIEVKDLKKVYGGEADSEVCALDGMNASVERGEFTAIMGPSGSGKSTLMNILGCLDTPSAGQYILDGQNVSGLSKDALADVRNQKIGFIFQSFNLLPRLSALENVLLPLLYDTREAQPQERQRQRAITALESVGLGHRMGHHPNQLSGGQQQRVAIARALINQPPLILADEPTGNLDSRSSVEIMALLHDLHKQGATIVMVTHEPDIARHAGRVLCVRDGRLISDGRGGNNPCLAREVAA